MNKKIATITFRNVILAGIYIFAISQLLYYGNDLFGNIENQNLAPFAMLLLFCLSAAIVGILVFGQAVMLFLDKKKLESIKSVIYSIFWMFLITLTVVLVLIIK